MSEHASASSTAAATRHRDLHRIVFDLVIVLFLATFVVSSLGLRPDSRLVPLIVGLPTLAAIAVQTVLDIRGSTEPEAGQRVEVGAPDAAAMAAASLTDLARAARDEVEAEAEAEAGRLESRRQRVFALWATAVLLLPVLATGLLDPILGLRTYFLPATVVGLLFITRWVGLSWLRSVAVTVGITAFMYLMLGVMLGVRL